MKNLYVIYGFASGIDLAETLYGIYHKGLREANPFFQGLTPTEMIVYKVLGTAFVILVASQIFKVAEDRGVTPMIYWAFVVSLVIQTMAVVNNAILIIQ